MLARTSVDPIPPGAIYTYETVVTPEHTAHSFGDRFPKILATPTLLGWMEVAAEGCIKPHLRDGQVSVGFKVEMTHHRSAHPGDMVWVRMQLVKCFGDLLLFTGEAGCGDHSIASISHQRQVIDSDGRA